MNVAYLDPPYSRYFHALAGRLVAGETSSDDGSGKASAQGSVVALLSSPAYRQYTAGDRALVWQPGLSDAPHAVPDDYVSSGWMAGDARSRAVFAHAVEWFKARFIEEQTELVLVFSDVRPFSVAARVAAHELGRICVFFERGAFRFITASLSTQGLNSRYSLRQGQAGPALGELIETEPRHRRPPEPWLRLRFAGFMARNTLACALRPDRALIQHKRYALGPYLRLAFAQWWTEHHDVSADAKALAIARDRPLVVVPLQLQSDSQWKLHSPFRDIQEFIDFVCREVRAACPAAELVFKRHPMDTRRYVLTGGAHWFSGNVARLYDRAPLVVCLNSTVGFEALVHGMRVICFGPSFYSEARTLRLATPETFGPHVREALAEPGDAAGGEALREAVLRCYQAPGDVWSFTDEDIASTATIVLNHLRAAQAGADRAAAAERSSPSRLNAVAAEPASASDGARPARPADRPAEPPAPSSAVPTALARLM